MGLFDAVGDLLGGSSESATTTGTTEPWKPQQQYLLDLYGQGQTQFNQGIPDVSASQALGGNAVQAYQNLIGQNVGGNTINAGAGAVQHLSNPGILDPSSNPALQAYMQQAGANTARNFAQGVSTNIEAPASIYNQVGSSRHGVAQGIAGQGLADALALQQSQLAAAGYGQGLEALARGASLAPGVSQGQQSQALFDPTVASQAAGLQYGLDTQNYDLETQRLTNYQNLIYGNQGGTTTSEGPGTKSGGLVGALGGAAGGGAIASALPASMAYMAPWAVGAGAFLGMMG